MFIEQCIENSFEEKKCFAINQLTGQVVCITPNRNVISIFDGESDNEDFLESLLFDEDEILRTWNLLDDEQAASHLAKVRRRLEKTFVD